VPVRFRPRAPQIRPYGSIAVRPFSFPLWEVALTSARMCAEGCRNPGVCGGTFGGTKLQIGGTLIGAMPPARCPSSGVRGDANSGLRQAVPAVFLARWEKLARAWTVGKPLKAYKPHQSAPTRRSQNGPLTFSLARASAEKPPRNPPSSTKPPTRTTVETTSRKSPTCTVTALGRG
jgi:hypothetical protein